MSGYLTMEYKVNKTQGAAAVTMGPHRAAHLLVLVRRTQ